MRTPQRKAGKYSFEKIDPYITQKKYDQLKKDYDRLKKKIRPGLIAEVKRLALDGDFSENVAYQIAKGRLRGLNQRLDDIKEALVKSLIIHQPSQATSITLGSRVKFKLNNKIKEYTILGSSEVDLQAGVISHNSPIGKALMKKKKGDKFKEIIGQKESDIEIIDIY